MIKNLPLYIISGIMGLIAIYAGLAGKRILFISSPRAAVITLTAAGFIMCSSGAIGAFIAKAPMHPLTMAGYLLGTLALFAGIVQIFNLKVPYLGDPKTALFFIAAVVILKFIIGRMSFLIRSVS